MSSKSAKYLTNPEAVNYIAQMHPDWYVWITTEAQLKNFLQTVSGDQVWNAKARFYYLGNLLAKKYKNTLGEDCNIKFSQGEKEQVTNIINCLARLRSQYEIVPDENRLNQMREIFYDTFANKTWQKVPIEVVSQPMFVVEEKEYPPDIIEQPIQPIPIVEEKEYPLEIIGRPVEHPIIIAQPSTSEFKDVYEPSTVFVQPGMIERPSILEQPIPVVEEKEYPMDVGIPIQESKEPSVGYVPQPRAPHAFEIIPIPNKYSGDIDIRLLLWITNAEDIREFLVKFRMISSTGKVRVSELRDFGRVLKDKTKSISDFPACKNLKSQTKQQYTDILLSCIANVRNYYLREGGMTADTIDMYKDYLLNTEDFLIKYNASQQAPQAAEHPIINEFRFVYSVDELRLLIFKKYGLSVDKQKDLKHVADLLNDLTEGNCTIDVRNYNKEEVLVMMLDCINEYRSRNLLAVQLEDLSIGTNKRGTLFRKPSVQTARLERIDMEEKFYGQNIQYINNAFQDTKELQEMISGLYKTIYETMGEHLPPFESQLDTHCYAVMLLFKHVIEFMKQNQLDFNCVKIFSDVLCGFQQPMKKIYKPLDVQPKGQGSPHEAPQEIQGAPLAMPQGTLQEISLLLSEPELPERIRIKEQPRIKVVKNIGEFEKLMRMDKEVKELNVEEKINQYKTQIQDCLSLY